VSAPVFRFRLQRVLDLRQRAERDAATALVRAQEAEEAARAEQTALEAQRAQLAGDADASAGASVGALRTVGFLLERMDAHIAAAAQHTDQARTVVDQRQAVLQAAFRDRRALDRLRERHQEAWRGAEAASDRQRMDDIALTRFTQTAPGPAPDGAEPAR
jgi:flagellar FliJ protein